ncbi:hypothetical protein [Heliomicrobium gestii]|nr:hypothetical protein [Heliomicrobium gestii]
MAVMFHMGLAVLKEEDVPLKSLLFFAIPTSVFVEISRHTLDQYGFGLHVFVVLLSSTLFGRVILKLAPSKALLASLIGMIFLIAVQYLTYPVFSKLMQNPSFIQDDGMNMLYGWTSTILLIGVSYSVRYARKRFRTE